MSSALQYVSVAVLCMFGCRRDSQPPSYNASEQAQLTLGNAAQPAQAVAGCPPDPKFRVVYTLIEPKTWVLFERALADPIDRWESSRLWWEPELYARTTLTAAQAKETYDVDRPNRTWVFDDSGHACEVVPDQLLVLAEEVLVWTVDASACALKLDEYRDPRIALEQDTMPRTCRFEQATTSEPTLREIQEFGGGKLSRWFDLSQCPLSNCRLDFVFERSQVGDARVERGTVGWSDPESEMPCDGATEEFWQSVTRQDRGAFLWGAKLRVSGRLIDGIGHDYWVTNDDGLFEVYRAPTGEAQEPISVIRWFSDEEASDPTVWLCRDGMD